MPLVTAQNLAKSFGALDIFLGVSFAIPHHARVALVGPNGVGKTTLLRLIIGLDEPDEGSLHKARQLMIGYLPQEVSFSKSHRVDLQQTLGQYSLLAFSGLRSLEERLRELEREMLDSKKADDLLPRYGVLQETYEHQGGYTYQARTAQVVNGLGFTPEDHDRPLAQFSGGEQTRAFLARLLLEDPQLLVLDEPTNHLDIQAVEWLEGWLKDWKGAAILVSHDRYFLDSVANTVWELSSQGIEIYRGNYSAYLLQREERQRYQWLQYQAQQEFVQKEEDYIRRNISGQNTRQAKGRRKRLERMLRDDAVDAPTSEHLVRIKFGQARRSGDQVLVTRGLEIGFPQAESPLFHVPDLVLYRGECVAIMGPNGAGKTTFLKTLLGEIPPYGGQARLGASLKIGYFAQAHEGLNPMRSVLEELSADNPGLLPAEARDFLARFLFRGDDAFKTVESLSGGERGRLALAKLLLKDANLLLLDEPTNHLDIPSQEVLQAALAQFEGTILLITHDRYLVNAMATQLWMISPDETGLEVFTGGYPQYLEVRQQKAEMTKAKQARKPEKAKPSPKRNKTKLELEKIEASIADLEEQLRQLAQELADVGTDVDRVRQLGVRYAKLEEELNQQIVLWERLAKHQERA